MSEAFNLAALLVIAVLSLSAIWLHAYNDNLLQRIGLAVLCFGATMRFTTLLMGDDLLPTRYAVSYGAAIFAIGTVVKLWRNSNAPQKRRKDDRA